MANGSFVASKNYCRPAKEAFFPSDQIGWIDVRTQLLHHFLSFTPFPKLQHSRESVLFWRNVVITSVIIHCLYFGL